MRLDGRNYYRGFEISQEKTDKYFVDRIGGGNACNGIFANELEAKNWIDRNTSPMIEFLGEMYIYLAKAERHLYLYTETEPKIKDINVEWALWSLLKEHENKLPELDEYFHKAFRQTDVTHSGRIDSAIWRLLDSSVVFWIIFENFSKKEV